MSHQETAYTHSFAVGPPFFPAPVAAPGNIGHAAPPVSTLQVRAAPPQGHYYTKKGKLKKCNPPTKERREYGLRQVAITEEELVLIRPRTREQRLEVFIKNPIGFKGRVRCDMSEIKKINEHRSQDKTKRLIHLSERVSNDQDFKDKAAKAEARHKKYEELKQKGESTRTKKSLEELHRAQKGGL